MTERESAGDVETRRAATETAQAPGRATLDALEGLQLSTAQREKIETIRTELAQKLEPAQAAREAFVVEVLRQVEDGSLDADRLEQRRAALVSELERSKPEVIEAANALHAVLTPSQRQALLEARQRTVLAARLKQQL